MTLFKYKVRFFDDLDKELVVAEGYVFGIDEAEVFDILKKEYGDSIDRTELLFIDEMSAGPILETKGAIAENRHKTEAEEENNIW